MYCNKQSLICLRFIRSARRSVGLLKGNEYFGGAYNSFVFNPSLINQGLIGSGTETTKTIQQRGLNTVTPEDGECYLFIISKGRVGT